MSNPIYAIGDIHGQMADLDRVLQLIEKDGGPDAEVVFLGDYVDRGPDSKAVVEFLMEGCAANSNWTAIKGNHDRYLTRFVDDGIIHDPRTRAGLYWFDPRLGGDKTMLSYGVSAHLDQPVEPALAAARERVPENHLAFLRGLPLYYETDAVTFVHAGVRPGIAMAAQDEDDLLWIRDGFLDFTGSFEKLIVHGHTALDAPKHEGNRVNMDGGAGYFRPLHAAVFEDTACWLLSETGRIPLTP